MNLGAGVDRRVTARVKRVLGVSKGRMPLTYPGVTTGMKRLPVRAFDPLIERIKELPLWKATTLSFCRQGHASEGNTSSNSHISLRIWPNDPA